MACTNIFIYDNISSLRTPGGVIRYFQRISDGLTDYFGAQATIFSSQKRNYGQARHIHALPINFRGSGRLGIIKTNNYLASQIAKQLHASVFFSPYYGNVQTTAAKIYTVHDMIYELFFPRTKKNQAFIDEKRHCIEHAALLITVSQSTAHDIIACYPYINPERIITTMLGVDNFFFEGPKN